MSIVIRKVQPEDRQSIFEIEKKATPGLSYLPFVFEQFTADEEGEFLIAEMDSQSIGCGKFTLLPDGTAWLEALRVVPERQGQGVGKQFYKRFFELGYSRHAPVMRMYTGIRNHTSRGLAESFGFSIAGTYRGQKRACQPIQHPVSQAAFRRVKDPVLASELLLSQKDRWAGFMVMNRTFYAITPALAKYLVDRGMLYHDPATQSVITLGARFMPQQALHIGILNGNIDDGLSFAFQQGVQAGVGSIDCLSPASASDFQTELANHHFQYESADFIVMEVNLA